MLDYKILCLELSENQKQAIKALQKTPITSVNTNDKTYIYKLLYYNQLDANQKALKILSSSLKEVETT